MTTDRAPDAPVAPIVAAVRAALAGVGDPSRAAAAGVHEVGDALPRHHLARSQGPPAPAVRRPGARPGVTRGVGVVGAWPVGRRDAPGGAACRDRAHRAPRRARGRTPTRSGSTGTSWRPAPGGTSSTPSPPTASADPVAAQAIVTPVVQSYAVDDHLWVRRTAILAQLTHRDDTDVAPHRGARREPRGVDPRAGVLHPQGRGVGAAPVRAHRP